MKLDRALNLASLIARQAGDLLRDHFQTGLTAQFKGAIDLVTQADMDSEALILDRLRQAFPDHHILAEEHGENHVVSDFTWIVDPLDGTTNFTHGFPQFSVSIALQHRDEVVVGVVYDVMRDEMYTATKERASAMNGCSIHVSGTPSLGRSLLVTGFPYDRQTSAENNLDHFGAFLMRAQGVLRLGSAALDLCTVAAGRLDGYWELKLKPWDMAAGVLIVAQAGGQVSDWRSPRFNLATGRVLASNPHIHAEMLAVLGNCRDGGDIRQK